jgi:hypothetical protein
MTDKLLDDLVSELRDIKKLLMLNSLAMGYQQKHLAAALGVSAATLSRMLPKGLQSEMTKKTSK